MHISEFDYPLPESLIAKQPLKQRDAARLLVADSIVQHRQVRNLVDYLQKGDVVVLNNSKVFRAKLLARVKGRKLLKECILLKPLGDGVWEALLRHMRKVRVGEVLILSGVEALLVEKCEESGVVHIRFSLTDREVFEHTDRYGEVPMPPYIEHEGVTLEEYDTLNAKEVGSVAASTAGRHITTNLMDAMRRKGVQIVEITLHIGLGTFQPIWVENIHEHEIHSEWTSISKEAALVVNAAKQQGGRVVAIGTTSLRALEGAAEGGCLPSDGFSGDIDLYIKPGYQFQLVDILLTNFHLPKSSLLVLVAAFIGLESMKQIYEIGLRERYRFYSLGDAMLLFRKH